MEQKKLGLILAYRGVNYGMLLQAYATQKFIERQGFKTEILEYTRTSYKHIRFTPWLPVYAADEILKRIKKKKQNKAEILDEVHKNNISDRKKVSNKFIESSLTNRRVINGIAALEEAGKEYDGVLIGSDQIWPPDAAFGNFTTLRFVPDSTNKISYATSLGVSSYPFYCRSSAAQFWKRINYLSVREEQGKRIIQDICNIPVEVVVDPTYLFTGDEWKEFIPEQQIVAGDYILCYFLGATKRHKELARDFANKQGLKLVSILSTESVSDIDLSYADEIITGKGPNDFINLIRNAKYILTDSFHGVAFSVINNKQFYVFYRTKIGSKNSRNSRIDNILNMWELQDRLVRNDATVDEFSLSDINYEHVNKLVASKRDHSISFLINALGEC
ncbi:polysaccharide pyruvyl transferase family protein [uncultured Ruminococcus sp.]|uniref:polysaccharide pyruvyl transferase family protein n=1 Tax=uncultured Ruminococcus sp. TaxID=165186 RepID=UPI002614EB74|nr:polysaccharide pyruvyl transferase family protein [uncultured Ruminococcus sp.]